MTQHETAKLIAEFVADDAHTLWYVRSYETAEIDKVRGIWYSYVEHLTGRIESLLKEADK